MLFRSGVFNDEFISIDDLPLLVEATVFGADCDVLIFTVLVALNFDVLSSLVDQETSLIPEELEPSGIGGPDLKVSGSSSALDVE